MDPQQHTGRSHWRSPLGIFMVAAGAVGAYYLLTEHFDHAAQAIPYLFLLACPLMHLLHRHGHHGRHRDGPAKDAASHR